MGGSDRQCGKRWRRSPRSPRSSSFVGSPHPPTNHAGASEKARTTGADDATGRTAEEDTGNGAETRRDGERRILLIAGAVVVLAGVGVGAFLAGWPSRVSRDFARTWPRRAARARRAPEKVADRGDEPQTPAGHGFEGGRPACSHSVSWRHSCSSQRPDAPPGRGIQCRRHTGTRRAPRGGEGPRRARRSRGSSGHRARVERAARHTRRAHAIRGRAHGPPGCARGLKGRSTLTAGDAHGVNGRSPVVLPSRHAMTLVEACSSSPR